MDLNIPPPMSPEPEPELEPAACSICLDSVLAASPGTRSVATLQCGHTFHLDCIGSAFNAKGIMQCPNCRHTENGNWLTANELQPSTDSDSHFAAVTRETYQVISGPGYNINRIRIRSMTMEAHQLLSDLLQQPTIDGSIPLNSVFRNPELQSGSYRTTGMEGEPTADLSNTQVFDGSEPRNSEIEQYHLGATPMVDFVNHPTAPFGFELPRYDGSSQRHSTQPTPGSGSSSVAPLRTSSPTVTSRDHGRHRLMRGHVQQTAPQLATRSRPYTDPISRRNVRPRAASIASSIAAYRAEDREPHDIYRARATNLENIIHNQQETASRRADQLHYLFGQWRSSAEPGTGSSQHNQENNGSSFPSGSTSELPPEFRSENSYLSAPSNWRNPFL
ncbi:unnamed protein product [Urochloa decumbens]|uniref:RING-type domain-containing protein n=1 Tax=Urochloa decumbens TaxID=240449 RepID=A0ABC9G441_9POAL